jgi:hypothetical protein
MSALWLQPDTAAAQSCTVNANTNVTVDNAGAPGDDAFKSDNEPNLMNSNWAAQTFTVTGSGCFMLNQITVSLKKVGTPNDLFVAIYDVASDTPTTLKSSATISASSVGTNYADVVITFGSPVQIQGGSQYALVLYQSGTAPGGNHYYQAGANDGNTYDGGRFCKSGDSGSSWDCPSGPGGGIDIRMSICVSPCLSVQGCARTQGYWKNHLTNWPVTSLTLGNHTYSQIELLNIFDQPVVGNGLISLAHQLIAAKLNAATGATVPPDVQAAITAADGLIGNLWIPPTAASTDFLAPALTGNFTTTLDAYNNGLAPGGPPHCQ